MNLHDQLSCLEAAGLITDSQMNQMQKVASKLPSSQADLLALIAASALTQTEDMLLSTVIGTQSLTSSDTADVKTLTVPADASRAIISVHGNNIIFRMDGGTPAANTGHFGEKNKNFMIGSLSSFKFISESTVDAIVFVTYY